MCLEDLTKSEIKISTYISNVWLRPRLEILSEFWRVLSDCKTWEKLKGLQSQGWLNLIAK